MSGLRINTPVFADHNEITEMEKTKTDGRLASGVKELLKGSCCDAPKRM